MKTFLQDQYGRTFKTLRVSLTNACNLGCIYCTSSSDKKTSDNNTSKNSLGYKEIAYAVKKIHQLTNLDTLRITGGEPTLYKDLIPFIKEINSTGIKNIRMTSNGYLLKGLITDLAESGLNKINISLDAVDPVSFNKISGRNNLNKVLDAIDHALGYGMEIKINAVILKGINDDQIIPLLKFSKDRKITLRFLELMRMGPLYQNKKFDEYFFSESEMLRIISENYFFSSLPRQDSSTANYWIDSESYIFGIIANESNPFCHDCNRLRLDSYGNIYGCLSSDESIPIKDFLNDDHMLAQKLAFALSQKQELKFTGSAVSMMAIGG